MSKTDELALSCKLRLAVDNPNDPDFSLSQRELGDVLNCLNAYEKQWSDMDYTIGHLRQENAELKAELLALREMFPTTRPQPTQDPTTSIAYGLYPSSARPVNPNPSKSENWVGYTPIDPQTK